MESEKTRAVWEGKARGKVRSGTAEQVWPFVEDFCNLHKWLPSIDTCYRIKGEYAKPGLIRYSSITRDKTTLWTLERLLTMDPIQRCFSYDIVDNNAGFHSYVATWKVMDEVVVDQEGHEQHGCVIEWSAIADPIDGWKFEAFLRFGESGIQGVAKRIDEALQSTKKVGKNPVPSHEVWPKPSALPMCLAKPMDLPSVKIRYHFMLNGRFKSNL